MKLIQSISILFLAALMAFAGCSSGTDAKSNGASLAAFSGGTSGLVLTFSDNAPPAKILDNGKQPFNVFVLVENKGEYDIAQGQANVVISGISPQEYNLLETSKPVSPLNGVTKKGTQTIAGKKTQISFTALKYLSDIVSGTTSATLYANVCYTYKTYAVAEMCVSENPGAVIDTKAKVCDVDGTKKFSSSGAPVQIQNVKQTSQGEGSIELQFDIVTTTKSTGSVYKVGSIDAECKINGASLTSADAQLEKDKVRYTVDTGIPGLNCEGTNTNTNEAYLVAGKATVSCVQNTKGQGDDYVRQYKVLLEYDYFDRISKTVSIEHVGK